MLTGGPLEGQVVALEHPAVVIRKFDGCAALAEPRTDEYQTVRVIEGHYVPRCPSAIQPIIDVQSGAQIFDWTGWGA